MLCRCGRCMRGQHHSGGWECLLRLLLKRLQYGSCLQDANCRAASGKQLLQAGLQRARRGITAAASQSRLLQRCSSRPGCFQLRGNRAGCGKGGPGCQQGVPLLELLHLLLQCCI